MRIANSIDHTVAGIAPTAMLRAALRPRLTRLVDTVQAWRQRAVERRQLLGMDDRALRDIGISRVDAIREANKPLWQG